MDFRSAMFAAVNVIPDLPTYQHMDIADLLVRETEAAATKGAASVTFGHERLVAIALDSNEVRAHMFNSQKIYAVKALRDLTGAGLKESRDAVEDHRVMALYVPPF